LVAVRLRRLSPSSAKEATPRTGCKGRRVASVSVEETDVHLSSHLQLLGDLWDSESTSGRNWRCGIITPGFGCSSICLMPHTHPGRLDDDVQPPIIRLWVSTMRACGGAKVNLQGLVGLLPSYIAPKSSLKTR